MDYLSARHWMRQFKPYERQVKSGGTLRSAQRYSYDNNDNLDAITDLVQSNQSISMTFDGLDRLSTAGGVWGSGSFGYDTLGNISSKVLGSQNLSYSYQSASNRLNTVTGGYSFSYDDRGNVINNGKRSFQFNRANQLVSSGTISYQYDGHGRRVKKTGSSSGYSVYDLSGTLLLSDGPNGQTRYIHLGKELIAKTGTAAAMEDKPGYTGHVEDKDLSLTYMQQRYYDPVIGRFYSNDPVGFTASNPMSFNRYLYVNNNPYKYTDPDGNYMFPISSGAPGNINLRPMNPFFIKPSPALTFSKATDLTSKGATIATAVCLAMCQPAVPYLGYLAAGSGMASAVTGDNPGKDVALEVGSLGVGRKLNALGDLAKGANELEGARCCCR